MTIDPLDLLDGLVLDTGDRWGSIAKPFQRADVTAILNRSDGAPRRHWLLRGRGMSKTTDIAALALVLLLTEAPPKSHSYVYAVDGDQAQLTMDAIDAIVANTPGLAGAVQVGARSITVRASGATLTIETSDGASSLGTKPWLTICDELAAWPNTANHRRLWASIVGALPKVPGSRLVVISTAGSPAGLGAQTWKKGLKSRFWNTSRNPGPSPWWTEDDIESTRDDLLPSEWMRYVECEWAEGEDTLTTAEDVAACTRGGDAVLPPHRGRQYVAALDIGSRRDLTALAIGHIEQREAGRTVVIDRVLSWKPAKNRHVDLADVEASTLRLCREYRVSRLRFDRMQAEQMTQNLARKGVRCDEFIFSTASTNRLARVLGTALRDRAIDLPDDPELQSQLATVRIVETGPGTVKMQNPTGTHDDLAVAVAMVAADLLSQPDLVGGVISTAQGSIGRRSNITTREAIRRPRPGSGLAGALAANRAKRMPRGLPGAGAVVGVPGAHDDPRRPH